MTIRDQLWGGGELIADSPEASTPVPPNAKERESFIKRARALLDIGRPSHIVTESADALRKVPEGVTHEEQTDFLEATRQRANESYEAQIESHTQGLE